MKIQTGPSRLRPAGFTLVEMLVAMSVLLVMLAMIFGISMQVTHAWKSTSGTIEGFRDARAAFEAMTRTISHATLNTYFDYVDNSTPPKFRDPSNAATFTPAGYGRRSDLQFVSGSSNKTLLNSVPGQVPYPVTHSIFFLAPLGDTSNAAYTSLSGTLNAIGFYINYGPDPTIPSYLTATNVPKLNRFRLMQFTEPAENLSIYDPKGAGNQWFLGPISNTPASTMQLAQNVIAVIIWPKLTPGDAAVSAQPNIAPNYDYDSADNTSAVTYNQLPPQVEVTMVVIDEASALKLGNTAAPPNLLQGSGFTNASLFDADMANLEKNLSGQAGNTAGNNIPLHYRIFHSSVALSSAKWSN